MIVAFLVIIFELSSIHYHYTGIVAQVNGMNAVTDSSYAYPYYSDEWVGISLTQYSIASHHLPMKNPLDADKPFSNPLVVFYSLAAELLLLFNLNPLTGWAVLALANGLFVCVLVYIVVRGAKGKSVCRKRCRTERAADCECNKCSGHLVFRAISRKLHRAFDRACIVDSRRWRARYVVGGWSFCSRTYFISPECPFYRADRACIDFEK